MDHFREGMEVGYPSRCFLERFKYFRAHGFANEQHIRIASFIHLQTLATRQMKYSVRRHSQQQWLVADRSAQQLAALQFTQY
jgi:hypothetical protein